MPMLTAGYAPAEQQLQPYEEAFGPTTVDGGGGEELRGAQNVNDQRVVTTNPHPVPVELRVPGVDDRDAYAPVHAYSLRTDSTDADWWQLNDGLHIAQTPEAAQPYGAMGPEAPVYGSTWRLEPQPADTGWTVGVGVG